MIVFPIRRWFCSFIGNNTTYTMKKTSNFFHFKARHNSQCILFFLIVPLLMMENQFNWINRVFKCSPKLVYGNCGIGFVLVVIVFCYYSEHRRMAFGDYLWSTYFFKALLCLWTQTYFITHAIYYLLITQSLLNEVSQSTFIYILHSHSVAVSIAVENSASKPFEKFHMIWIFFSNMTSRNLQILLLSRTYLLIKK